jgi:hypothetical protein
MKAIALFLLILLLLLGLPFLFPSGGGVQRDIPLPPAPWQIEAEPGGDSRVFGLRPGRSTLEEARRLLGGDPQVALIVAPGESGAVEAYFESVQAGPVSGRMVLTLASTAEQREGMLKRARKADYMESTTRRVELGDQDLMLAQKAAIEALVFIPAANLDEQIVLQRFGTPAERIRSGEHREHFLYPDKGLDLQLDAKGKEVLQYVAPRDFARLRAPLGTGK